MKNQIKKNEPQQTEEINDTRSVKNYDPDFTVVTEEESSVYITNSVKAEVISYDF